MSLFDFKFEKLIAQKVVCGLYIPYVVIFSLAGVVALFGLSTADQPVWGASHYCDWLHLVARYFESCI